MAAVVGASCWRLRGARSSFDRASCGLDPRQPTGVSACYGDFVAGDLWDSMGGAPVALDGWHALDTSVARSERAKTGLIGRSPNVLVGKSGIYGLWRSRSASIGRVWWASMGEGGRGRLGFLSIRAYGSCVSCVCN